MSFNTLLSLVLLIGLAVYPSITRADKLKIQGIAGGDKVVVMGDARRNPGSSGCVNDLVSRSTGETTLPNFLSSAGCNSEIAIFSAGNAMRLETPVTTWTDDPGDVHTATLRPIIRVPARVWIADDTPGTETRAKDDMKHANALYRENKVGVRFVAVFKDVSADANAVSTITGGVSAPTSTNISCTAGITPLQTSAYYKIKTLNVYYVKPAFSGRNCAIRQVPPGCDCTCAMGQPADGDGNITYIGNKNNGNRATLAHEFGHAFGLRPAPCGGHTDVVAGFGPENIMQGGGDENRNRFTLGQVFRMNTHIDKWGGTMLINNGLRAGPGRRCAPLTSNAKCPVLKKDWTRP